MDYSSALRVSISVTPAQKAKGTILLVWQKPCWHFILHLFLKLQFYIRQLLKCSFADCLKRKMALPLCKYWFVKKYSVLSYTPTIKCNRFISFVLLLFQFLCGWSCPKVSHLHVLHILPCFLPPNFAFFFSKCHPLYDKINYWTEKVIFNQVQSPYYIWKMDTISHPSSVLSLCTVL